MDVLLSAEVRGDPPEPFLFQSLTGSAPYEQVGHSQSPSGTPIGVANLVATTSDAAPVRKHLQTKHDNIQQDGQAQLPRNRCDIQIVPERKEIRK